MKVTTRVQGNIAVKESCRKRDCTDATVHKWRSKYGGPLARCASSLLIGATALTSSFVWADVTDYVRFQYGITAHGSIEKDGPTYDLVLAPSSLDGTVGALMLRSPSNPVGTQLLQLTIDGSTLVLPAESAATSSNSVFGACYLSPSGQLAKLANLQTEMTTSISGLSDCVGRVGQDAPFVMVATLGAPVIVTRPLFAGTVPLIEALPVTITRNDTLWRTYYFGYRLGIVKIVSHYPGLWPNFNPTSLPTPSVDGTVIEYNNRLDYPTAPSGHYFYSADIAEQNSVDSGLFGRWERTGKSFYSGGYLPLCRFYGSVSPGPNSHFFTVDPDECNGLKSKQITPIPIDLQQWNFEGNGFYTSFAQSVAGVVTCPPGTVPVYRAYNNAYPASGPKNPWDSNHRFSVNKTDIDTLVSQLGWKDEGIRMCAPAQATQ